MRLVMYIAKEMKRIYPLKAVSYTHLDVYKRQIVMKGVKDKNFNWVVERLYDVATKVCQNSNIADGVGADPAGSRCV